MKDVVIAYNDMKINKMIKVNFFLWPRWNIWDQNDSLIWNNNKKDKVYKTMVFKTPNIREWRAVIPNRQTTNEMGSHTLQASALREFPVCGAKTGNPGGTHITSWVMEKDQRLWREWQVELSRQSTIENRDA